MNAQIVLRPNAILSLVPTMSRQSAAASTLTIGMMTEYQTTRMPISLSATATSSVLRIFFPKGRARTPTAPFLSWPLSYGLYMLRLRRGRAVFLRGLLASGDELPLRMSLRRNGPDRAGTAKVYPAPWSSGWKEWDIPIGWSDRIGEIKGRSRPNSEIERFEIDQSGAVTIRKFGHWIKRAPNNRVWVDGRCVN